MLQGKTALITGSNRGIGKATLEAFIENGATTVFAHARKESPEFTQMIADMKSGSSCEIIPIYFDMVDEGAIKDGVKLLRSYGKVDILVNNAGVIGKQSSFLMTPLNDMKAVFNVNVWGTVLLTQLIARMMVSQRCGVIINLSSISALDGLGYFDYVASKSAWSGATKKMAQELGQFGVRVNAVAPGVIESDMSRSMNPVAVQQTINKTTLSRLGKTGEVAKTIVFLSSDDASYITGQIVRIDGGM